MQHGVTVDILCIVKLQEYRGEFFNEIRMKTSKWEKKIPLVNLRHVFYL